MCRIGQRIETEINDPLTIGRCDLGGRLAINSSMAFGLAGLILRTFTVINNEKKTHLSNVHIMQASDTIFLVAFAIACIGVTMRCWGLAIAFDQMRNQQGAVPQQGALQV